MGQMKPDAAVKRDARKRRPQPWRQLRVVQAVQPLCFVQTVSRGRSFLPRPALEKEEGGGGLNAIWRQ
jgi:hypothetical protein